VENVGQLSVVCNANDIAVMGATPQYMLLTLLVPPGGDSVATIETILKQVKCLNTSCAHSCLGS
jgi:hydrogenase maturation factor